MKTIKESIDDAMKEIAIWPKWKRDFIGLENDNTFNEKVRKNVGDYIKNNYF